MRNLSSEASQSFDEGYGHLRIVAPKNTGDGDRNLLIHGDQVRWTLKVLEVAECDHPLKSGRPEKDREWACGMSQERPERTGPGKREDCLLKGWNYH